MIVVEVHSLAISESMAIYKVVKLLAIMIGMLLLHVLYVVRSIELPTYHTPFIMLWLFLIFRVVVIVKLGRDWTMTST